jgi:hypothetical protein
MGEELGRRVQKRAMDSGSIVYCFGDSWAYGSELNDPQVIEHPFVHWFAQELNLPYKNYGEEGASMGIILHRLASKLSTITANDIVLVVLPPDVRWYDENKEKGFYTLMQWQKEDYLKSLNNKTVEWFKYHHLLFIYTIQQSLNDIGCRYILAHNYGQLPTNETYGFNLDHDKFLSSTNLTTLISSYNNKWTRNLDTYESYQLDVDGPMYSHKFHGEYFQGTVCHPNEKGHKRIAELLIEKFKGSLV